MINGCWIVNDKGERIPGVIGKDGKAVPVDAPKAATAKPAKEK